MHEARVLPLKKPRPTTVSGYIAEHPQKHLLYRTLAEKAIKAEFDKYKSTGTEEAASRLEKIKKIASKMPEEDRVHFEQLLELIQNPKFLKHLIALRSGSGPIRTHLQMAIALYVDYERNLHKSDRAKRKLTPLFEWIRDQDI